MCLLIFFLMSLFPVSRIQGSHSYLSAMSFSCSIDCAVHLPLPHFLGVMSSQNQDFEFERANVPLIYKSNVLTKKLESKEIVSLGFSS